MRLIEHVHDGLIAFHVQAFETYYVYTASHFRPKCESASLAELCVGSALIIVN